MDQHFNVWLYYNMLPLYNRQFRPSKATISQAILAIRPTYWCNQEEELFGQ